MRCKEIVLASVTLGVLAASSSFASTKKNTQYSFKQVWRTTVRYLRVDAKIDILEKDADAGYVLFEMKDNDRRYEGSVEIVDRTKDGQQNDVRIVLDIKNRPEYVESMMTNKIASKLREEYGLPPSPPKKKPKAPPKEESPEVKEAESPSSEKSN